MAAKHDHHHDHYEFKCEDIYKLRVEYKKNPLGMDEPRPRFSYIQVPETQQVARHIQVISPNGKIHWDSGWVDDASSQQIEYEGPALQPFTRYDWRVRLRYDNGTESDWSTETAFFETGFMDKPWSAKWIRSRNESGFGLIPPVFGGHFETLKGKGKIVAARYYGSALGLYEATLNGTQVTDVTLLPGWTDYTKRVQYQAFDITPLVRNGHNDLQITLASGWHSGRIAMHWFDNNMPYRTPPMVIAELHIVYADGTRQIFGTDKSFQLTEYGPVRFSDIYDGEVVEAWRTPELLKKEPWLPAQETTCPIKVEWNAGPLTRRISTLKPKSIVRRGSTWIVDFGQNFTGRERLHIKAAVNGATIVIHHGEMLNQDGSLYTDNLRSARALDVYTCKGGPEEHYEPHFTFHGFRYLAISGWPGRLTKAAVEAVVLSSDLERSGWFHCSDPMLNALYECTGWGMRSNFVDVPTDCPQRDERMGWTCDTQVFCNTATYHVYAPDFYAKWMKDMNGYAADHGSYPHIMPVNKEMGEAPTGWSDAGLIVPWILYVKYGDKRLLEESFPLMRKHLDTQIRLAGPSLIGTCDCYGDWLNINAPTTHEYIATAYMAGMARLLAKIAAALDKKADAALAESQYDQIRKAFQKRFIANGKLTESTQCAYLMALHFDLLPQTMVPAVVDKLVKDIRDTHHLHLSTGFLGTPLLLPVLTRFGHADLAYDLLRQTTYPSWLYPVTQGATTMWERWNSYTHKDGFGDVSMNSFNHYAYGAVAEWFYEAILGIQPIDNPKSLAFKHFRLSPCFTDKLDFAEGAFLSPNGSIVSQWDRQANGEFIWNFMVPGNTTAEIVFPAGKLTEFKKLALDEDGKGHENKLHGIDLLASVGKAKSWQVGPGMYSITLQTKAANVKGKAK